MVAFIPNWLEGYQPSTKCLWQIQLLWSWTPPSKTPNHPLTWTHIVWRRFFVSWQQIPPFHLELRRASWAGATHHHDLTLWWYFFSNLTIMQHALWQMNNVQQITFSKKLKVPCQEVQKTFWVEGNIAAEPFIQVWNHLKTLSFGCSYITCVKSKWKF